MTAPANDTVPAASAPPPARPDPGATAACVFTVVTFLLGLQFTTAVPASSALAYIPILLAGGVVLIVLGVSAVLQGDHVIGMFFSIFGSFLVSFGLLSLGLIHGWWPVPPVDLAHVEGTFLMGWAVVVTLWLALSVVLVRFFSVLLLVIDLALWALVIGTWHTNAAMDKTAGWLLLLTALGGAYFMAARWLAWAGFAGLPLGRPLVSVTAPAPTDRPRTAPAGDLQTSPSS